MISFNEIPITLRTPGVYVEISNERAIGGLVRDAFRLLVIGQKLPTGTAAAGVAVRFTRADEAVGLFGRGSMLAGMCAALKAVNETTETWALPLDDNGAGVAATKTITFGGAQTQAGTVPLLVCGVKAPVAVALADTLAQIATKAATAINDLPDLPVTAAAVGAVVTVTARHKGVAGNDIDIRTAYYAGEKNPAGLTVVVADGVVGTTNPDITAPLAALGDVQYHQVIMPYTDAANLTALETDLVSRWSGTRMIEGQAWSAAAGTFSALTTLGAARNSPFVSIMGTGKSPTPPWIWAAVYGGVAAYHLEIDPARPLQTLPLRGVLPPAEGVRFTRAERNLLLYDGIATYVVQPDGLVQIEREITTYQVNALNLPDPSYLDTTTPATLGAMRATLRARIAQRFPRHKLANDGTNFAPGQAIVTPLLIRDELIAVARLWEERGWCENIDAFKEQLIVVRNVDDVNRIDALIPPDIVNQLRVFAGKIEFRL